MLKWPPAEARSQGRLTKASPPLDLEPPNFMPGPIFVTFAEAIPDRLRKHQIPSMDLHHPILREFPEYREVIRRLKGSDDHFRKMFDEYHHLDDAVYRIEEEIDFATDQEIEELKMRRAKLKDYIYHLVRHAPPSCPACEGTGIARQAAARL